MITYHEWQTMNRPDIQKLMAEGVIPARVMKALQSIRGFSKDEIGMLVAMLGVAGGATFSGMAAMGDKGPPVADVQPDAPAGTKPVIPNVPGANMAPPH